MWPKDINHYLKTKTHYADNKTKAIYNHSLNQKIIFKKSSAINKVGNQKLEQQSQNFELVKAWRN